MKKLAITLMVLSCSANSYSSTPIQVTDCPSVEMVKAHSTFNEATDMIIPANNWQLINTHGYYNKGRIWFTTMSINIPNVQTSQEALVRGNEFYQRNIQLKEPIVLYGQYCEYTESNPQQYSVMAMTDNQ